MSTNGGLMRSHPGRGWSLLDMLRLRLDAFWEASAEWHEAAVTLIFVDSAEKGEDGSELTDEEKKGIRKTMKRMRRTCDAIGLSTSSILIQHKLAVLPKSHSEMNMIWLTIRSELESKMFVYIQDDKSDYIDKEDYLDESGRLAFPTASQELRSAGNALAFDLPTACVFHSMRALEYGLRAMAADLGVTVGVQSWQGVITDIQNAIEAVRKGPTGVSKNERLQFLSEAANEFGYFKDGWRNYASHTKVNYDDAQARRIVEHVSTFIGLLSTHLKEAP